MNWLARSTALLLLLLAPFARAAETQTQYLSGHGKDDTVQWQFLCDKGQHAGTWSTIGVPSNWELQGFGIYTYGRVKPQDGWPKVHGTYKRSFTTPASWQGRTVLINFEGVMTDAQVTINGQSAGPVHQGGYYAFKYDITRLLRPAGQQNSLQVDVDDESGNESVNHAERRGDFWNYGGIFRPVFLQAVPRDFVDHVAISAAASGALDVDVAVSGTGDVPHGAAASLSVQVLDLQGKPVGKPVIATDVALNTTTHLKEQLSNPRLWTAETPNLYQLQVELRSGRTTVHTVRQRFGFRTVELRPGQGLFVNGNRVFLRGVDRHSFWPDSGRTLSEQISRDDINIIKDLNGNAVRSSHYPPDAHFLAACDELGLYVLDELTGWQANYDTAVGKKLVREMVEHDVNHPSILFWDNGNEGGFNFDLDGEFAKYDPERRVVLHPWAAFPPGIADTKHYPNYETLQQKLAADPVFFPTEMLHGLYDGGAGAGMSDYWAAILKSKAGAGGFVWAFLDEDVKRTDKGGILDSQGNMAPDGIVGPYREREGSFYTIRQLWSPIIVTSSGGASPSYTVSNRYSFLNPSGCTFEWQWIAFPTPGDAASGSKVLVSRVDGGRSLLPGASASWSGWGPPSLGQNKTAEPDAVRLIIRDATGRTIQTYVWPAGNLSHRVQAATSAAPVSTPIATDGDGILTATAGDLSLRISKTSGLLVSASRNGQIFRMGHGPRVVAAGPRPAATRRQDPPPLPQTSAPDSKLTSLTHHSDHGDLVISATFDGPMRSLNYRLKPDGWLSIDYVYAVTGPHEYFGVGFDYPEADVTGMRFLGEGPSPVYQNRLAGGTLDVWNRTYNNTMVGDPADLKPGEHFNYPIFKGFYAGVRWLQLQTSQGPITATLETRSDSPVYVQIFTPKIAPGNLPGQTAVPFPDAGISFLNAIPAIGSKFGAPSSMGPASQPAIANGEYTGRVNLYFGKLPAR